MIKIKSEVTGEEIFAVDATLKFEFGNHTEIEDVYWAITGEIFPKVKDRSFDEVMGRIYDLPKSVWNSKLINHQVYVNANPKCNSAISGNSKKDGTYTSKTKIRNYINKQLSKGVSLNKFEQISDQAIPKTKLKIREITDLPEKAGKYIISITDIFTLDDIYATFDGKKWVDLNEYLELTKGDLSRITYYDYQPITKNKISVMYFTDGMDKPPTKDDFSIPTNLSLVKNENKKLKLK